MVSRDTLRDAIAPLFTFLLCLAASTQLSLYTYRAAQHDLSDELAALRREIPPPVFRAQVDRLEGRLDRLDERVRKLEVQP